MTFVMVNSLEFMIRSHEKREVTNFLCTNDATICIMYTNFAKSVVESNLECI